VKGGRTRFWWVVGGLVGCWGAVCVVVGGPADKGTLSPQSCPLEEGEEVFCRKRKGEKVWSGDDEKD